jgi:hypothetical protein
MKGSSVGSPNQARCQALWITEPGARVQAPWVNWIQPPAVYSPPALAPLLAVGGERHGAHGVEGHRVARLPDAAVRLQREVGLPLPGGVRLVTPASQIGYTDDTGCHQSNRVLAAK